MLTNYALKILHNNAINWHFQESTAMLPSYGIFQNAQQ